MIKLFVCDFVWFQILYHAHSNHIVLFGIIVYHMMRKYLFCNNQKVTLESSRPNVTLSFLKSCSSAKKHIPSHSVNRYQQHNHHHQTKHVSHYNLMTSHVFFEQCLRIYHEYQCYITHHSIISLPFNF